MEGFSDFAQLETNRLILRQMTLSDAEFYFRHFNMKEIIEGSCFPGPRNREAAVEESERYCIRPFTENKGIRWGIALKGSSELIGTLGYYDWDKTSSS